MILRNWDDLPPKIKNESVRKYYEVLYKKKVSLFFNRVLDVAFGIIILLILSPVFLIVGITIKIDSPGPVLFRQERVTQYGKLFKIYKFRTMVQNAENLGSKIAVHNDARVTKVGWYLRRKRLDEIPQLLNIIKGDMTFVGTRPEVNKFVEQYSDEMLATLLLRAGVTSKASIQYKNEEDIVKADTDKSYIDIILPEKMKINLQSIEEYSILKEIKILIMTVIKIKEKNNYNDLDVVRNKEVTM